MSKKPKDPYPPLTPEQAHRFLKATDPHPSIDAITMAMQDRAAAIEANPELMVGNPDRVWEILRRGLKPLS